MANKGGQEVVSEIVETIQPPEKRTHGLPIGSQANFIEAAECAAICGFPINALLTVRWVSLYHHDNTNPLFAQSPVERIAYLVELLRKWVGARCRGGFLYLCRHCYRLAYPSQREKPGDRAARRADRIRDKMGWPGGILEGGDWGKPKGMHWRTYERLCREHDALSDRALVGIMDHLNRLSGRF